MREVKQHPGSLRAGAAQVDITPKAGVQLAGDIGRRRPARLVSDPLYAKALVFESNGRKLCFVGLDLTVITRQYSALIRQTATENFGFEPEAVMIHPTQTHSAPSLGHFMLDEDFPALPPQYDWIRGGDESYNSFAVACIGQAIRLANEALQPVQIGVGSGIEGRVAFNRRAVKRDGSVGMPGRRWEEPLGPTWIRYIEGPIDPELGVMCVRTESLHMVAMLVNYTCHPVHLLPKPIVSADWPGALADQLRKAYGQDCVAVVLNGACGNINPWPPYNSDYVEDHWRMGRVLATTAGKVIETLPFQDEAILDWKTKHVKIPIRQVDPQQLDKAEQLLAQHPQPVWTDEECTRVDSDWMRAAEVLSVYLHQRRQPELDYEIQVFRVGDTAFVSLPGEPFVEGGLRIKLASPAYPTYIVHMTTKYVGYIPTKEALARGGHEVATSYWAKLVPEALDMVVEAAVGLLHEVFPI